MGEGEKRKRNEGGERLREKRGRGEMRHYAGKVERKI